MQQHPDWTGQRIKDALMSSAKGLAEWYTPYEVGTGRLDVRIQSAGYHVTVAIADHGPGIPPDKRLRVFEPYYTEKTEGTGLGLSLVKQAVDHHRGTITVAETPGGGATFEVKFPAA